MSYHLIPKFETKEETFAYIVKNEKKIREQKMAAVKFSDPVEYSPLYVLDGGDIVSHKTLMAAKANTINLSMPIKIKAIINTTNLLDSHGDAHMPGIWNKSLSDRKIFDLVKEHNFKFDGTICDEAKGSAQTYNWNDLGASYYGTTQALVFDAVIDPTDKTGMFELYAKGKVKNHSVGMVYKNYAICINSEDENYQMYKANWDKYRPMVVNGETADEEGYFWAVTEAKIIEGSAVKAGSNWITPTQSVENVNENSNKEQGNEFEPHQSTQQSSAKLYSFEDLLNQIKIN